MPHLHLSEFSERLGRVDSVAGNIQRTRRRWIESCFNPSDVKIFIEITGLSRKIVLRQLTNNRKRVFFGVRREFHVRFYANVRRLTNGENDVRILLSRLRVESFLRMQDRGFLNRLHNEDQHSRPVRPHRTFLIGPPKTSGEFAKFVKDRTAGIAGTDADVDHFRFIQRAVVFKDRFAFFFQVTRKIERNVVGQSTFVKFKIVQPLRRTVAARPESILKIGHVQRNWNRDNILGFRNNKRGKVPFFVAQNDATRVSFTRKTNLDRFIRLAHDVPVR